MARVTERSEPGAWYEIPHRIVIWLCFKQIEFKDILKENKQERCKIAIERSLPDNEGMAIDWVSVDRLTLEWITWAIDRAVTGMHPEHRKLYRLRYIDCLSVEKIAKRTKKSMGTISYRLKEMTQQVAQYLLAVPSEHITEILKEL